MPQLESLSIFISLTLFLLQRIHITCTAKNTYCGIQQRTLTKRPANGEDTKASNGVRYLQLSSVIRSSPFRNLLSNTPSGPNLRLESAGVHEEQTQDLNATIVMSYHSHNLSSTTSLTNNSTNTVTPNSSVSPEISVLQINPTIQSDSHHTINMPMTPYASPPHEDNKLGFQVFAVELVGSLTNLAVSAKPNHDQLLIYLVMACSTLAFSVSSTALLLHKKRPAIAKKMQKAAFIIVCMLMFAVANLIE